MAPFGGWLKEPLENRKPAILESELVSLCGEPQIVTFPFDLGFVLTARGPRSKGRNLLELRCKRGNFDV